MIDDDLSERMHQVLTQVANGEVWVKLPVASYVALCSVVENADWMCSATTKEQLKKAQHRHRMLRERIKP